MEDLLRKISSYNIFNYLLPGTLFAFVGTSITSFSLVHDDLFVAVFLYYFFGLIISRIGSIVVEPVLKKARVVKFAPYVQFLEASKKDSKIEELSEANNMYRTMISLFVFLLGLSGFEEIADRFSWIEDHAITIILILLMVLFVLAYRKQTAFIDERVSKAKSDT